MSADDSTGRADAVGRPYSSAIAVERAADLLFLIAEREQASLNELSRAIGSSSGAVHRILLALRKKGLIQQTTENGPYSMSWSILALTQRLTAEADLRTVSRPHIVELRDMTGETVTLNVRSGFSRVCIDQAVGPHEVTWRQDIGKISPLYAGATGKVLMAYLSKEELKAFWRAVKPQKLTPFTTVRRDELRREFEVIRERGYAYGTQDRILGVGGLAAPIFDSAGNAAATLTIAGPADRCNPEQLERWVQPLTSATAQISQFVADAALAGPDLGSALVAAPALAGEAARR